MLYFVDRSVHRVIAMRFGLWRGRTVRSQRHERLGVTFELNETRLYLPLLWWYLWTPFVIIWRQEQYDGKVPTQQIGGPDRGRWYNNLTERNQ